MKCRQSFIVSIVRCLPSPRFIHITRKNFVGPCCYIFILRLTCLFLSGVVTYSSHMDSDGSISYRRDIEAPCEHGMLLFSVGPAKDDLPYKYDIYEDAYLYSDNGGLCIFYPTYTGFQISSEPWWTPTDPMRIDVKPLDKSKMHWISSRFVNPHKSKKTVDGKIAGDYVIIAKHDFYTPHYYQALKATVNSWK